MEKVPKIAGAQTAEYVWHVDILLYLRDMP